MSRNTPFPCGLILFLIIALGFFLRLFGIGFGLPFLYHADEPIVVNHAAAYGLGDFNPHFFAIPPFVSYILFFFYGLYFLAGKLFGLFSSVEQFKNLFLVNPAPFYLIGRFVAGVFFGAASIYAVYVLGRRFYDRKTGLISAAFLSTNFLHVQHSHYIYTDILLSFSVILTAIVVLKLHKQASLKLYVLAGMCAGLAAGVKYNGAFVFIMIITAHFLELGFRKIKFLIISGVAMVLTFILLNPFSVLDFLSFINGVRGQAHAQAFDIRMLWHHSKYSLVEGLSIFIVVLGMAGTLLGFKRDAKLNLVMLSFPVLFFIALWPFGQAHERYVLPLVPFFCVYAGFFISYVFGKKPSVCALLAVVLCIMPFLKSAYLDILFTQADTRTMAKAWIGMNIPEAAKIALDNSFFSPPLEQCSGQVREKLSLTDDPGKIEKINRILSLPKHGRTYNVYYLKKEGETGTGFLFEQPQIPFSMDQIYANNIEYVVIHRAFSYGEAKEFYDELKKHAVLIKRFSPYFDQKRNYSYDTLIQTACPFKSQELFARFMTGYIIEIYKVEKDLE